MRRILILLAAVTLGAGLVGTAPASADSSGPSTVTAKPGAYNHGEGHKHSHPHGRDGGSRRHERNFHDEDHDDHGDDHGDGHGRRRRCEGLIVICLV